MISAYERDRRQPTVPTLMRLLKGAGFDLTMHLVPSDPHDDVLAELDCSARSSRIAVAGTGRSTHGETQSQSRPEVPSRSP